jgi:hypothetical protein
MAKTNRFYFYGENVTNTQYNAILRKQAKILLRQANKWISSKNYVKPINVYPESYELARKALRCCML